MAKKFLFCLTDSTTRLQAGHSFTLKLQGPQVMTCLHFETKHKLCYEDKQHILQFHVLRFLLLLR